ncbi:MBL fold metallo-hydrolase [Candidatus Halobonum tyrrellensis]|uniref:MBL fold metallo-hydrolase n=1 Tax=Candidatus Halobonum tyrrellensis TaxID=1431545 RepID=UPI000677E8FF|nr:MBL fold metallo-hydrolase [Candidatus Halobonum tyrrellensis]
MRVERVPVPVETRAPDGRTNAYLVAGGTTLLVDPPARSDDLDAAVDDADPGVDHVAVTHTHPDHVGAVAAYAERTGATVWARRGRETAFEAATGVAPDRTFVEGDRVGPATALDLQGHAPDGVGFETDAGVVCGDVAVAEGSVVVGAPDGDVRAYLTALRRLHARDPPRLFAGHGAVVDDPRATCERLIDHRLTRERAVLAAVEGGARSLDGVLAAAYGKDLTGVRDLARATVRAHVEKLVRDGDLRWDADAERVDLA